MLPNCGTSIQSGSKRLSFHLPYKNAYRILLYITTNVFDNISYPFHINYRCPN